MQVGKMVAKLNQTSQATQIIIVNLVTWRHKVQLDWRHISGDPFATCFLPYFRKMISIAFGVSFSANLFQRLCVSASINFVV